MLDIPLLFEKGGADEVDTVAVVSRRAEVQRARVLARPGMTPEKFLRILAQQLPDAEKRARADFVIPTDCSLDETRASVRRILACLGRRRRFIACAMREIVFDTETTGLSPPSGDRMVEIGCVELVNRVATGRTFHAYFNPGRPMPSEAEAVHGLSDRFLVRQAALPRRLRGAARVHRRFAAGRAQAALRFRLPQPRARRVRPARASARSRMVDTLALARQKFPGAKHSLDALCTRYGVDRSQRVKHGALLDAQLLAQVYVELTGGRQIGLGLVAELIEATMRPSAADSARPRAAPSTRPPAAPARAERGGAGAAHRLPGDDQRPDLESALGARRG